MGATYGDNGRTLESELAHFGIKGMRWGVRRNNPSGGSGGESETKVQTKPGKGVVKTSGGKGASPHEDAVRAAAAKQKAKTSTVDSLSNKELQDLITRMNLEQQYGKLMTPENTKKKSKGRAFIDHVVSNEAKSVVLKGKPGPVTATVGGAIMAYYLGTGGRGKHGGKAGLSSVKNILSPGTGKRRK